jgi:hypothetical protein
MAIGRCSGLFSEGVTSWDETGQCCHWRIIPIFSFDNFGACWLLYVSTISWLTHRDCRIFIVRAWCCECVHTLDLVLSKRRESHQPQVIRPPPSPPPPPTRFPVLPVLVVWSCIYFFASCLKPGLILACRVTGNKTWACLSPHSVTGKTLWLQNHKLVRQ